MLLTRVAQNLCKKKARELGLCSAIRKGFFVRYPLRLELGASSVFHTALQNV